jgi:hypothetical protein
MKIVSNKLFKIRNKKTGLFSPGGASAMHDVYWKKTGKVWAGLGPLKSHLTLLVEASGAESNLTRKLENWEVVEYELTEVKVTDAIKSVNLVKLLKSDYAS